MIFRYEINHDVLFINVEGDLLGLPEDQKLLNFAEEQMLDNHITRCAIDISKVNYMNSTGLTILIRILTMYRNTGGEVVLINPSQSVSKVLIITKLNAIFQVLKSKEDVFPALYPKKLVAA
ncbi:MAG: STAS domain-containing protein [Thermoflexibacter sp.]|jgi:anti-sigma B factor antagonist|nr:STAS domain-containing protein [Thermoflexibacter sp.]